MFVLNGKPLALDRAFSHDGVQYPGNWLRNSSPEQRAAIGIEERPEPPSWDQRFYWGYDEDGQLIPKQLNDEPVLDEDGLPQLDAMGQQIVATGLKTLYVQEQKRTAETLLAPYDWYVVRQMEAGKAMPSEVAGYRRAVREASDQREDEIMATTSVDELRSLMFETISPWPQQP